MGPELKTRFPSNSPPLARRGEMKMPVSKSNVFNTVPTLNISRDFCVLQIILSPTYIAQLCFYLCRRIISIFQNVRQGMFYEIDVGKKCDKYIKKGRGKCRIVIKMLFGSHGDSLSLSFPYQRPVAVSLVNLCI